MKFTAQQIADMLEGQIIGDPQTQVHTLAKIEEGTPGSLSFLANPQYTEHLYSTQASVVIISRDFMPEQSVKPTLIQVADAYASFASLLELYNTIRHSKTGIHPAATISDKAQIGQDVYVAAGAVVEDGVQIGDGSKIYSNATLNSGVKVGKNCLIFNNVVVYDHCVIGDEVTLHAGVVIGGDGFGFAPRQEGEAFHKVAQIGNVIIEDGVEVGANTTIDRATMGSTIIRRGVKLDNLIQIAHNVEIGENTVIASQTGIAGSTKIGKNCMIAGQVGIIGHLKIGDGVKIAAQSGISANIPDGGVVQGSPAFAVGAYTRSYVYFRKLPQIIKELQALLPAKKEVRP